MRAVRLLAVAMIMGGIIAGHLVGSVAGPASVQAVGSALLLWSSLAPGWRWLGPAVGAVLLTGIGVGVAVAPGVVKLIVPGLGHALLYAGLLWAFGRSLRPGGVALVTRLARRTNPRFRAGMVPYTRAVTAAWCVFAAVQLVGSAALLAAAWVGVWQGLVTGGHAAMAVALGLAEYAVRRRRFPGEHTSLLETIRGVRRFRSS